MPETRLSTAVWIERVLKRVTLPGVCGNEVRVRLTRDMAIQLEWTAPCTFTGKEQLQRGRKWRISEHMTESEFVGTLFKAVLTATEHELREQFKYKGYPVFTPHLNLDGMVQLFEQGNALSYRRNPDGK